MEQNQESSLFGLNIDPSSRNHLWETARWARFLAIMGFIVCGLALIMGVFAGTIFQNWVDHSLLGPDAAADTNSVRLRTGIVYTIVAIVYFFPCLYLFNFASKMRTALIANDQNTMNESFKNLKKTFRFVGVLTIIILVFWIIGLLMVVLVLASQKSLP